MVHPIQTYIHKHTIRGYTGNQCNVNSQQVGKWTKTTHIGKELHTYTSQCHLSDCATWLTTAIMQRTTRHHNVSLQAAWQLRTAACWLPVHPGMANWNGANNDSNWYTAPRWLTSHEAAHHRTQAKQSNVEVILHSTIVEWDVHGATHTIIYTYTHH